MLQIFGFKQVLATIAREQVRYHVTFSHTAIFHGGEAHSHPLVSFAMIGAARGDFHYDQAGT
jgi:hypothetical protein